MLVGLFGGYRDMNGDGDANVGGGGGAVVRRGLTQD